MVKKIFYTSAGDVERELTSAEIEAFALAGDIECRYELLKTELASATTVDEVKTVVNKLLELI